MVFEMADVWERAPLLGQVGGRFAPSTTGDVHPGTVISALLAWLDCRTHGGEFWLRLDDMDRSRRAEVWRVSVMAQLDWLGLSYDGVLLQSRGQGLHQKMLEVFADAGLLYACDCSRAQIRKDCAQKAIAQRADGGLPYPGTCRNMRIQNCDWSALQGKATLRLMLPSPHREAFGDPVLWRRDGIPSFLWASLIDDIWLGTPRWVRGYDLQTSTATQEVIGELLRSSALAGSKACAHRRWCDRLPAGAWPAQHHFLFLEPADKDTNKDKSHGDAASLQASKMAKMHGSIGLSTLAQHYTPSALLGMLAFWGGLAKSMQPTSPQKLLADFSWDRVRTTDCLLAWQHNALYSVGEGIPASGNP